MPTKHHHRGKFTCVSRATELGKCWHLYVPKLISFSVWIGTYEFCLHNITCFAVILCYIRLYMQCSFPFIYYSWHGTMISQTTGKHLYSEIIFVVCERAERARKMFVLLHSKPAISFIILLLFPPTSNIGGYIPTPPPLHPRFTPMSCSIFSMMS